jgi:murein DD-endopeptidase MepM/ murein hydrolase activator NlpD
MKLVMPLALMLLGVQAGPPPAGLEGYWEGAITTGGPPFRVTLSIIRADDGLYLGRAEYPEVGFPMMPSRIDRASLENGAVRLAIEGGMVFEGTIAAGGAAMSGEWIEGGTKSPASFTRAKRPDAAREPPLDVPLDAKVPAPPVPFLGGAQHHLAYELHLTNLGDTNARLQKLEVLFDDRVAAAYEGPALNEILSWPGNPVADNRRLAPWGFTVAWIWISQPRATALPKEIRHRFTVDGRTTTTEPVRPSPTPAPVIGPPLKGGVWIALNGPGADSGHRLSMMTIEGRLRIPQRFGVDWIRAAAGVAAVASAGADVIAVSDGTVVHVKDGVPDNQPGAKAPAVPITVDTVGGNVVVLDIGGGHFVFYAHLQPGLPVKAGQRVTRGQLLGKVGNSGDSLAPHLHFHVMNAASYGEGVPFLIDRFEALAGANPGVRTNASPMNRARVRFPE